jgi:branched-chain amino acid transport system permease protein
MTRLGLSRAESVSFVLLVVGVALAPLLLSGNRFWMSLVGFTFAFAIFAMGLHVMLGWAGEIPLGLALFYGLGAYTTSIAMKEHSQSFLVGTVIAIGIAAVLAVVIGAITLRLSGAYFAIVSWGLAAVGVIVANNSDELTGGALGMFGVPTAEIGPLSLSDPDTYLWVSGTLLVLVVAGLALLRRSAFGVRVNGGRLNPHLAESVGIDVYSDKVKAFIVASGLSALSGALSVSYLGIVTPGTMAVTTTVEALLMVLLGGTGFLLGPVIGALFFKLVPEWIHLEAEVRMVLFALLIIVIMMTAPGGLPDIVKRLTGLRRGRGRGSGGPPDAKGEALPSSSDTGGSLQPVPTSGSER